ncbi:MAG: hypothetical protein V1799_07835 [bacterium]
MTIETILDAEAIRRFAGKDEGRLVDRIEYKLSTLSKSFTDIHALVALENDKMIGMLPLCKFRGRTEMIGQFWAEGYVLPFSNEVWNEMQERLECPVAIQYCRENRPGMRQMPVESSVVSFSRMSDYLHMFNRSDARRDLKKAAVYYEVADFGVKYGFDEEDFERLVLFSRERLGANSRITESDRAESFLGLCRYLTSVKSLVVVNYTIKAQNVGVAFLSHDRIDGSLTFLLGFFDSGHNNFGKYMYITYVDIACTLGCSKVSAMSPMYRVKSDMQFTGVPMYCYERLYEGI